ncbi:MAG: sodium:calcium antiporter [Candidatus Thermofonsia Clade 1 bacterium]|uniref:Sodium:calcium antiporter n=1 Tax=Candidatus Thermofonsia Clade 1 bacterium TaxID=2364210 RepID=A0A2M8P335_9CHLR|nr:MAG: sodium:calcium antiporter [Candidatus Thermofonsia Clade 1 bacterium]
MLLQDALLVVLGLLGLFFGGNWLVKGAARLALSLGVSTLIVGLTIVAFGTSLPEMFVSVDAVLQGATDISVGNVVGSNIANIGLILGLTALVFPVAVKRQVTRRDLPIMLIVSVLMFVLIQNREISRVEGLLLFGGIIAYTAISYLLELRERRTAAETDDLDEAEFGPDPRHANRFFELGRLIVGLTVVVVGANLLVQGSVNIATALGVPKLIIGLTLVAVGTSLPELATSFIASLHKENDIAVGNIVGSNIFNILAILGVTATVRPIGINQRVLDVDILIMLAFSLALLLIVLRGRVARWQGGLLLAAYLVFTIWAFTTHGGV